MNRVIKEHLIQLFIDFCCLVEKGPSIHRWIRPVMVVAGSTRFRQVTTFLNMPCFWANYAHSEWLICWWAAYLLTSSKKNVTVVMFIVVKLDFKRVPNVMELELAKFLFILFHWNSIPWEIVHRIFLRQNQLFFNSWLLLTTHIPSLSSMKLDACW